MRAIALVSSLLVLLPTAARADECVEIRRMCSHLGGGWNMAAVPERSLSFGAPPHSLAARGLELSTHLPSAVYLGTEVQVGGGRTSSTLLTSTPEVRTSGGLRHLAGGVLVGAHLLSLGDIGLSTKVREGARVISVLLTTPDDCSNFDGEAQDCSRSAGQWVVEPHLLFDYWLTPWISISAFAGASAPRTMDCLSVAFQLQSFAGERVTP